MSTYCKSCVRFSVLCRRASTLPRFVRTLFLLDDPYGLELWFFECARRDVQWSPTVPSQSCPPLYLILPSGSSPSSVLFSRTYEEGPGSTRNGGRHEEWWKVQGRVGRYREGPEGTGSGRNTQGGAGNFKRPRRRTTSGVRCHTVSLTHYFLWRVFSLYGKGVESYKTSLKLLKCGFEEQERMNLQIFFSWCNQRHTCKYSIRGLGFVNRLFIWSLRNSIASGGRGKPPTVGVEFWVTYVVCVSPILRRTGPPGTWSPSGLENRVTLW